MHTSLKTVAIALCASLTLGGVAVPQASAATEQREISVRVHGETPNAEQGRIDGEVRKDSRARLAYVHPAAAVGIHEFTVYSNIWIDGKNLAPNWGASTDVRKDGGADVITYTYTDARSDVEITRTFRIYGNRIDVDVRARNAGKQRRQVDIELANELQNPYQVSARETKADTYKVGPESEGYDTTVSFTDPNFSGTREQLTQEQSKGIGEGTPKLQAGEWIEVLDPGESVEARASVSVAAQESAIDTDGDGLRDEWELKGLKLEDGTELPIQNWGADPDRPDLFLQLNWMQAEWETLNCARKDDFAPTVKEFEQFAGCATANVNSYRPSTSTLRDLEDVFAKEGIALHIDAGETYQSASLAGYEEPHGGKTERFEQYYFQDKSQAQRLLDERNRLLGPRKAVFRIGIIGDKMAEGNRSSGVALVRDSAFYIADHKDMTTQEQLRNTIFHEFGHTLGLGHSGPEVPDNPLSGDVYVPEYKSVMNYLYQFSYFDYAKEPTDARVNACVKGGGCGEQSVTIPADWSNLDLPGFNIGQGNVTTGSGQLDDDDDQSEKTPRKLAENAAVANVGKAGFQMDTTASGDNGIVTASEENFATGTISNLGADAERFTLVANYPGGQRYTEEITLAGIQDKRSEREVKIPIRNANSISGPTLPVNVQIFNHSGESVFTDRYELSVLDYTADEAERVLNDVLKSDASPQVKRMAKSKLDGVTDRAPAAATKLNTKTPSEKQAEKPTRQQEEPVSAVAIVVAVLLALGGIAAAGAGWALSQGLI